MSGASANVKRDICYGSFLCLSVRHNITIDLREARQTQSPALSPITHGSSSSSPSSLSPLASYLTRSVFYSELKTWLFCKSFPP